MTKFTMFINFFHCKNIYVHEITTPKLEEKKTDPTTTKKYKIKKKLKKRTKITKQEESKDE